MENEKDGKKEVIGVTAQTINNLVDAMGAITRSLVATMPPAQQKVFLQRMDDAAESATKTGDRQLNLLIQTLVAIGRSEQRH